MCLFCFCLHVFSIALHIVMLREAFLRMRIPSYGKGSTLAHVSLPLKSFLFAVLDASILPHQAWGGVVWEERQP